MLNEVQHSEAADTPTSDVAGPAREWSPRIGAIAENTLRDDDRSKLLNAYSEWLFYERRLLCMEIHPGVEGADGFVPQNTGAGEYHFPMHPRGWETEPQPSTRAAAVLEAVGCDWINRGRRPSKAAEPDPVFALIKAEQAAFDHFELARQPMDSVRTGREPTGEEDAEYERAVSASDQAILDVMAARPTSQAGLKAKLDLLVEREGSDYHPDFVTALIESLRTTPFGILPSASGVERPRPVGNDGDLLALHAELERINALKVAFEAEHPTADNPHYDRDWELRAAIEARPAATLEGLAVKAYAAAAARSCGEDADCIAAGSFATLSESLIADVQRLASGGIQREPAPVAYLQAAE